jgi:diguanylate cyclase (GGDEF)-like protein
MSQGNDPPKRHTAPSDSLRTLKLDEGARVREELYRSIREDRRPVLVVIAGSDVGVRRKLDRNLAVGRAPTADFILTDAGISWLHCRFEDRGGAWAVVDLGSTNGTAVNGKKVPEQLLHPNDRISIGRTVVRFEEQDAVEAAYDDQVERMLNIDDLTGLMLRRRFDKEFAQLFHSAKERNGPLAVLVMDLDGVKKINDTFGHRFGAHVISEAGRVIGAVITPPCIASRFGGDEFCAALPNATTTAAMVMAESVRGAIAQHRFEYEGVVLSPGISIGVASYPEDVPEFATLFQRADEAMYRAKQGGRNRVSR